MKNIELLAPAGSKETLIAAINAGANAVYLGGKFFGARRSAQNFSNEALAESIKYSHERNVSVYVTINTLIKDVELTDVIEFIDFLYVNDVDAVILQDLGLLNLIKRKYPDLHCHASTQMTFHDLDGVISAQNLGFSRVVLSRELSFEEIKVIADQVKIELEFFVHGALCISYSGQCLMSSYIGGRSGNRGACAQPCRRQYKLLNNTTGDETEKVYLMSPKDLMTYEHLEDLKKLKNVSLKIEGRMKGADYVYSIVNTYRRGIDFGVDKNEVINFSRTFNRQFTTGFMFDDSYKALMNYEIPSSYGVPVARVITLSDEHLQLKLLDTLNKGDEIQFRDKGETVGTRTDVIILKGVRVHRAVEGDTVTVPFKYKVPQNGIFYKTYDKEFIDEMQIQSQIQRAVHFVTFEFVAQKGLPAKLTAVFNDDPDKKFRVESEKNVESAQSRPLDKSRIIEQLSKIGGTPFSIHLINVALDENISMPISEINRMRRVCLESYLEDQSKRYRNRISMTDEKHRVIANKSAQPNNKLCKIDLVFERADDLISALNSRKNTSVIKNTFEYEFYLTDLTGFMKNMAFFKSEHVIPVLPRIIRNMDHIEIMAFLEAYVDKIIHKDDSDAKQKICLTHIGQLNLVKNYPLILESDYSMNAMNAQTGEILADLGFSKVTWSTELSKDELKKMRLKPENNRLFVYGHLPLMISEYCPVGGALLGHDRCGLCNKNRFSLIDERNIVYPLVCDPRHCRSEVMSDLPISLIDQIPMLVRTGYNAFRISIDGFDYNATQMIDKLFKLTELKNMDQIFPFDQGLHSRGSFNKGIE